MARRSLLKPGMSGRHRGDSFLDHLKERVNHNICVWTFTLCVMSMIRSTPRPTSISKADSGMLMNWHIESTFEE
ncbi:uncharacterized protein G2W53_042282 [Senna tora]|uniref:Uncharacterized protein n=1 Tax=Senna tora TaxID=362788 RepID=A0A834SH10_9FABA|nr:uncharacterized protein G2W53_042282 [Senna tora]